MTYTDPAVPVHTWETCDHCQAPLDERQRYCVACGARRPHADDPVARYFVEHARRARAGESAPQPGAAAPSRSSWWIAGVLALLPVAAAVGMMVGRGGSDGDQLVQALKAQKAPVVNVMGGTGAASDDAAADGGSDAESTAVEGDDPNDADGKVIARTRYGSARSLVDSRVTPEQIEESRKALDHIVNSQGREYVEQQRNLPDQIVIP